MKLPKIDLNYYFTKEQLPNTLTMFRVAVIPVIILLYQLPQPVGRYVTLILFLLAAISDFYDGHLSRKWGVVSDFGKMLDPIADKLLVATVLILMASTHHAHIIPVILIILREIFISGLREHLALSNISIPVSNLGKWKTTLQLVTVITLLAAPFGTALHGFGLILLWATAGITLYSGWDYWRNFLSKPPSGI